MIVWGFQTIWIVIISAVSSNKRKNHQAHPRDCLLLFKCFFKPKKFYISFKIKPSKQQVL
ncbi:hypothetical protein DQF64_14495 (plasmid) [Moraxella bovis]|nr:hypothetical protein DQF64_14495 [Moraxella bovis]